MTTKQRRIEKIVDDHLLDLLYAAATHRERWSELLERLCHSFDALGGSFVGHSFSAGESFFTAFHGLDPEVYRNYEPLVAEDPRVKYIQSFPGKPFCCSLDLPRNNLHASRVYREFLRPNGVEYTLAVAVDYDTDQGWALGLLRGPDSPPFAENDRDALGTLVPHLRRAVAIQREFMRLDSERWAVVDLLDQYPMGTIIADGDGRVVFASRAAHQMIERDAGLAIRHGMIWAKRGNESSALHAAIHEAVEQARSRTNGTTATLLPLSRPSSDRPLEVRIAPVMRDRAPQGMNGHGPPVAALFISDPDLPGERAPELLTRLYGLTRAEANFLATFLRAGNVPKTAEALGISVNTARSHLRSLFRKTGTGNQAELMRTVTASPAWQRNTATPPPAEYWTLLETIEQEPPRPAAARG